MNRIHCLWMTALLTVAGCTVGGKVADLNEKLDQRIQDDLDKRAKVVQGNPLYLELVKELNRGRNLFLSGQSKESYVIFDKILSDTRYSKYPEYAYAKYYLANAMSAMGIDYGSLLFFVDIVRKEPLRAHTHESLRRAIEIAQKLKDDELILFMASEIPPEKVPRSLREEFRYFIAKELYERKQYDKAAELLTTMPHTNRLYLGAQYLLGTMGVQKNDWRDAVQHFQEISNNRSKVIYYEDHRIRQLANLALGRIFYEQKNYPLAIVYYKKLEKDGDYYPSGLYEASWALFKLHKFNEALSVIHSLNSPFYEQVYFLKAYLMRGAIDLELCNYEEAVTSLGKLDSQFGDLGEQIDRFAKQARSPQEYYPLLSSKVRTPDGTEKFAYEAIFKLAAANRDFLAIHKYIQRLEREKETLKEVPSARSTLLSQLLSQKQADLTTKASYLAGKKLLITRQMIEDFKGLKDIIRYEIVSAERKILQKRSLGLAPPVIAGQDLIRPEFTESLKETMMWWDYNGEYWEDELGFYLIDRKSRCKEAAEGTNK